MKYDYDLITIGLGPAGMAVSIMGSQMGLKVCAIEKGRIGGECMNVGCIPSKSLIHMANSRHLFDRLDRMELAHSPKPKVLNPFGRIRDYLDMIREQKTMKMFDKVHLVHQKGPAHFVDPHTVAVGDQTYTARRIFLCLGTQPQVPSFPGLETIDYLTNNNLFQLETIPESLIVLGGGAIACEMAQAFSRLGAKVTIIIRGPRLMWREDQDATNLIEQTFEKDGITILRGNKPARFENVDGSVRIHTDKGQIVDGQKVLVAAGRTLDYTQVQLQNAGVNIDKNGAIIVNKHLQTSSRHIYAAGDCNGHFLFSHAAMHQGMIALINSMLPWPMKRDFRKYAVPWTVFTEPQISHVGMKPSELDEKGIQYETIRVDYDDYGAAIAEAVDIGFIKAYTSPAGKIYGAYIVGEGSGEMINEWALAVQKKIRMHDILMLQHSFPTMGFLTKRTAETWMMQKMKSNTLKKLCRWMYRL